MTDVVDFGGEEMGGISSANSPSMQDYFASMVEKDVPVRDGDDLIVFYENDDEEENPEEDESYNDETGSELPEFDFTPSESLEQNLGQMDNAQAAFEQMQDVAISRGMTPEMISTVEQDFASNGKLTDASFEILEQHGFPRDFVNNWFEGQVALTQAYYRGVIDSVGGDNAYHGIRSTLAKAGPSILQSFDEAVANRDLDKAKEFIALAGVNQSQANQAQVAQQQAQAKAYAQRYGQPAQRSLTQSAIPSTAVPQAQGFASKSDMAAAINDPRYARDADYTREVRTKIANSPW